ncbi:hypothetical protein [Thermoactinomyces mirandus]|nr:hypothetical protein [Thermoactinomyces mirandus]
MKFQRMTGMAVFAVGFNKDIFIKKEGLFYAATRLVTELEMGSAVAGNRI